jgi:hypothetical protein|tara:strand:- start:1116 stop:1535 length:420 start_codon:yes stop_codon:yes gene_type:complete
MAVPALINGQAYDYTQIIMSVLGVPVAGVTSINYTEEQEKTNNFGAGNRPVSRGRGAIEASGSIELSMNEIEALRDAAPSGSMLKIPPFEITIVYLNLQKVVTHKLKNVEFTNDGVETSQGDTDIRRTFDIVMSDVKYR